MVKKYIIEASVLYTEPKALYGFDDNILILTESTIRYLTELGQGNQKDSERGRNAKDALLMIEDIVKNNGRIGDNGWLLLPQPIAPVQSRLPYEQQLLNELQDLDGILVSNIVGLRLMAAMKRYHAEPYRNEQTLDQSYQGWRTIFLPDEQFEEFQETKKVSVEDIDIITDTNNVFCYENEYYIITKASDIHSCCYAIYQNGVLLDIPRFPIVYNMKAKNARQAFMLHALTAPASEIPLVILKGKAGTGKTIGALAAGLFATDTLGKYKSILLSRNNVLADEGFGALPGELSDKMGPLLDPFYDNLNNLLSLGEKDNSKIKAKINTFESRGIIDICALAYIRGRSLTNTYLIVDEAQNATRKQIRDIVTRAGENTKIILCGDVSQVDAPHLDQYTNGLAFSAETMKYSSKAALITFPEIDCVRSALAQEALKYMDF